MRRLEVGDTLYLSGSSSGLTSLLIADADELGSSFPFEELSDGEVAWVYRRKDWGRGDAHGAPHRAHQRLQWLIRQGSLKYVFLDYLDHSNVGLIDFGNDIRFSYGNWVATLMKRHEHGQLVREQIPESLWKLVAIYLEDLLSAVIGELEEYLTSLETVNVFPGGARVYTHLVPPKTTLLWRTKFGLRHGPNDIISREFRATMKLINLWPVLGRGGPCPVLVARQPGQVLSGGWEEERGLKAAHELRRALMEGCLIIVGDRDPETMVGVRRWLLGEGA